MGRHWSSSGSFSFPSPSRWRLFLSIFGRPTSSRERAHPRSRHYLSVWDSRAAGIAALALRFLIVVFAKPSQEAGQWEVLGALDWTQIVAWVSGLSMAFGGLLAFRQVAAKRMVGCLIVAESGFLLLGLLVLDEVGVGALLYNLVIELFALVGAFYILSFFHDELGTDHLVDLKGMLRRAAPESVFLVIFLLCLVGVPPTPGFIGKFTLIGEALRHHTGRCLRPCRSGRWSSAPWPWRGCAFT